MRPQAKGAATDVAAEALPVEEAALCAQSLHHVHPLAAKMADVAAAKAGGALLTRRTLRMRGSTRSQAHVAALRFTLNTAEAASAVGVFKHSSLLTEHSTSTQIMCIRVHFYLNTNIS